MDINKPFNYKELQEAIHKLNSKEEVHVNQQTYDVIMETIDFEPTNLVVNNYIPMNQAVIIDCESIRKAQEEIFKPKFILE